MTPISLIFFILSLSSELRRTHVVDQLRFFFFMNIHLWSSISTPPNTCLMHTQFLRNEAFNSETILNIQRTKHLKRSSHRNMELNPCCNAGRFLTLFSEMQLSFRFTGDWDYCSVCCRCRASIFYSTRRAYLATAIPFITPRSILSFYWCTMHACYLLLII